MGQRSQIYIRITDNYNKEPKLYAKYFGWNYGNLMISRAKYGIEYIKKLDPDNYSLDSVKEKINKIFDVNFDMIDVAISSNILHEYIDEEWYKDVKANEFIFNMQDNNDGKLFINISENGEVKYCFTDHELNILSPSQYMNWKEYFNELEKEKIDICNKNIQYINENAKLMTKEELNEFISRDYSKQIENLKELLHPSVKEIKSNNQEVEV